MTRALGPAVEVPGGLRVVLGLPERWEETITLAADEDLDRVRALAREVAGSPERDWLTVPTNRPDEVAEILLSAGLDLMEKPEWLMTRELDGHPEPGVPEPYSLTVTADGAVLEARIMAPGGELAAHGLMAVAGTDAVAHNIVTNEDHRRRGLASVVMGSLAAGARERGATTGLLLASEDGQRLYSVLGWETRSSVLIAGTHWTMSVASGALSAEVGTL